jgi:large subunit ribosomal protein L10
MQKSEKTEIIEELAGQIGGATSMIVADYRGLSVAQITKIRADLKASDATLVVSKNTLARVAAERSGADDLVAFLKGPSAIAFVRGDVAAAAKTLTEAATSTRILRVRGAVVDGRPFDAADVTAIARLPTRDVLVAQVVRGIAAPISGLVGTLAAVPRGLVVALEQVRQQKEAA